MWLQLVLVAVLGRCGVHANVAMMLAAAARLESGADEVKSRYRSTKDGVEHLLSSWKGIAPQVHQELWTDWDEGFELVESAMTHMAAVIAGAARTFHAVDSSGD